MKERERDPGVPGGAGLTHRQRLRVRPHVVHRHVARGKPELMPRREGGCLAHHNAIQPGPVFSGPFRPDPALLVGGRAC